MDGAILKKALAAAVKVAREESAAVARLESRIQSPAFGKALQLCLECGGVVYIIGMGKSGLVGQKMAATLSSTGTPAIYIHAGDALHGDLGAIRARDVAILISKSGETREILQTLPFLKSHANPVIAITNDGASSLAKSADVVIEMGVDNEACPMNLAPMTSTTVTVALGDALSSALIVARGFKPEDFAVFHPGGKLGWLLTAKVADVISRGKNPVCGLGDSLRQAVVKLVEYRLGGVNVVDEDGKLAGVLTDGDLKRIMLGGDDGALNRPVREFVKGSPVTIHSSATAAEALDLMEKRETQISVLPVVDDGGRPVGLLRIHDVIRPHL
jgi:arabinose-5-phosphate isomerase